MDARSEASSTFSDTACAQLNAAMRDATCAAYDLNVHALSHALLVPALCAMRVAVRVRPHEPDAHGAHALVCADARQVAVQGQQFAFDHVFAPDLSQESVYEQLKIDDMVEGALAGISGSVLAYGQTGSGKTYTMVGIPGPRDSSEAGLIARALVSLFNLTENGRAAGTLQSVDVRMTCVEVYRENLRDLLAKTECDLAEHVSALPRHIASPRSSKLASPRASLASPSPRGPLLSPATRDLASLSAAGAALPEIVVREARDGTVHIEGARCVVVSSAADALRHVRTAASQRTIGSTAMNATSSRSHAVFTLSISVCARVPATGAVRKSTAELVFVDLAGSEGCKRTGAEGERQREAISINLGLHHLTRVMHELVVQQRDRRSSGSHINYRSSKLTRLLQNALGGNSTTLIVACVSPRASDSTETIETLKYAERARKIKTRPLPNVTVASDPEKHGALVSQLTAELAQRDALLESARADLEFALAEQRAALEAGFERERAALAAAREELAAERSQLVARVEDEAAARHARELERLRTEHALEIHAERSARRCSASPSEALRLCTGQMPAAGLLRENKAVQAQLHCGGGCVKEGQLSAELDVGSVLRVLQSVLADDSVDGQSDGERSEGTCTNTMLSRTGTCLELDRTSDVGQ